MKAGQGDKVGELEATIELLAAQVRERLDVLEGRLSDLEARFSAAASLVITTHEGLTALAKFAAEMKETLTALKVLDRQPPEGTPGTTKAN